MSQVVVTGKVDVIFAEEDPKMGVAIGIMIPDSQVFAGDGSSTVDAMPMGVWVDDGELIRIVTESVRVGQIIRISGELGMLSKQIVLVPEKLWIITEDAFPEEDRCSYCGTKHLHGPCVYIQPQNRERK